MPFYTLIAHDRKNGLEQRIAHRPAHLEHMAHLDAAGRVQYSGPLLDEKGNMIGSLIIIEADDLESARATFAKDPYVIHGVFEDYDVLGTKKVFPRGN
jgi:hypothetical protein|tara:strand:+ start:193 stop:486 length:294 start_codon:yes stop_codon:yes gene_type:complete